MNTQNETDNRPSLKSLFLQVYDEDEQEIKLPSIEAVRAALEAGADVNEPIRSHGRTPLSPAIYYGDVELVRLLLEYGANVSESNGYHLMENAIIAYRFAKARFPKERKSYEKIIRLLFSNGVDPNARGKSNRTLLMLHNCNDVGITQLLIEQGADVNAQDEDGRTPLSYATCSPAYGYYKFRPKIISILLDAGADINLCDCRGRSSLMYAVKSLRGDDLMHTLQLLIARGADPTHCDLYGFTLSEYACFYEVPADVRRYINQVLNKPTDDGIVEQNDLEDMNPDEDDDYNGGNLLHMLFADNLCDLNFPRKERRKYCTELVRSVCTSGINVNERDHTGHTPLMYAAENWYNEVIIPILLEYGADPTIRDDNGFTALNYAQFNDASPEVLKLLTPKD